MGEAIPKDPWGNVGPRGNYSEKATGANDPKAEAILLDGSGLSLVDMPTDEQVIAAGSRFVIPQAKSANEVLSAAQEKAIGDRLSDSPLNGAQVVMPQEGASKPVDSTKHGYTPEGFQAQMEEAKNKRGWFKNLFN